MKNKLRSLTKKKSFKIILVLLLIMTVLYLLPVPPVGEPVESLALEYSKFVSVEGVRVHYVEVPGKGNMTFVLLHGFGASVFSWRDVMSNLTKYGRVIAFDRPGFGLTERADPASLNFNPYSTEGQVKLTYELLKKLNVSSAVLIGHSAGGGLALLITLEHPEIVEALVLVAPAWRARQKSLLENIFYSMPLADKYGPLIVRSFVGQLEQILYRAWYNKSMLTKEIIEGYKYPLKARDWDKGLYWLMKYGEFPEISNSLKNLKKPILIIHGVNDEIVPLSSSLDLVNLLSNESKHTLATISGCGHLPHEEKPEEFLKIVDEFIKEIT
ncbi:MAG: alpha/beta hydrolase [Zestosphaera sp.]